MYKIANLGDSNNEAMCRPEKKDLLASLLTFALGLMAAQVTTEIGTVNSSFA
ncbi:hypothetical protein APP_04110 [Aeribacillus pallidus]|nr:hypothetical protein APP_04110 [Aeribacillus pallidus]